MSRMLVNSFSVQPALPVVTGTQGGSAITPTSDATYYYMTFTANGTLTVSGAPLDVSLLVVAGGGAGGSLYVLNTYNTDGGGGGGAGGVLTTASPVSFAVGQHTVVIGAGGSGVNNDDGTKGANSSISSYTAIGGGAGAGSTGGNILGGGSGGGQCSVSVSNGRVSTATTNQGNVGGTYLGQYYASGGGGGAGGAGANGTYTLNNPTTTVRGVALNTTIGGVGGTGVTVFGRAVGGGGSGAGGPYYDYCAIQRVLGPGFGGGSSSQSAPTSYFADTRYTNFPQYQATSGDLNTGGGGGGAAYMGYLGTSTFSTWPGGNGGSGIVVVRYTRAQVGG